MDPLKAGDPRSIGRYVLTARLGAGGMGAVFLARSPGGRLVAVKQVHPHLADDAQFRQRFAQEVEIARRVGGFHTAQVVDADPDGDPPWLASAYIAGPTLAKAIAVHGPLPEHSLRVLGAGLAEAIEAIHSVGLIHRDLKPSNIVLADDGPRVIDFGIAKAMDATRSMTSTSVAVGTPGFMAPEQITRHAVVGPPVDVFCLGSVICYAANVEPFGTGDPHALLYRVMHEEPDLAGLPASLRTLVGRCLDKNPNARPSPQQIVVELAANDRPDGWLPATVQTMVTNQRPTVPDSAPAQAVSTQPAAKGARTSIEPPPPTRTDPTLRLSTPPVAASAPPAPTGSASSKRWPIIVTTLAVAIALTAAIILANNPGQHGSGQPMSTGTATQPVTTGPSGTQSGSTPTSGTPSTTITSTSTTTGLTTQTSPSTTTSPPRTPPPVPTLSGPADQARTTERTATTLTWETTAAASEVWVAYSPFGANWGPTTWTTAQPVSGWQTAHTYAFTPTQPGFYAWNVEAADGIGPDAMTSDHSPNRELVVFGTPPPKPTLQSPSNGATLPRDPAITLSWSGTAQIFKVCWQYGPSLNQLGQGHCEQGAYTQYTMPVIYPNSVYVWSVLASNDGGWSGTNSDTWYFTVTH